MITKFSYNDIFFDCLEERWKSHPDEWLMSFHICLSFIEEVGNEWERQNYKSRRFFPPDDVFPRDPRTLYKKIKEGSFATTPEIVQTCQAPYKDQRVQNLLSQTLQVFHEEANKDACKKLQEDFATMETTFSKMESRIHKASIAWTLVYLGKKKTTISYEGFICHRCHATREKVVICKNCSLPYCDRICRRVGWKKHKITCPGLTADRSSK